MAKIHISIVVFLCALALGQKLVSAETCTISLGPRISDFDCWLDCKKQYKGNGGCTDRHPVLSEPVYMPEDDENDYKGPHRCPCVCKYKSKLNEPCPDAPAPL